MAILFCLLGLILQTKETSRKCESNFCSGSSIIELLKFFADLSSVMTATSNPACCDDYYIGHCDLYLIQDKRRCSDFCVPGGCRGGECRYRDGLNACHCYCN
ncbi:hypothetical protein MKW94_014246 [Papaver nudicaule]|uniref:Defensin-like protein n=1 Tax=Papaver nudicaule TaxID=74823 RepID=A0AA41SLN2_PAPNU|nr:hypothetical protein [Papaver nudicaule]